MDELFDNSCVSIQESDELIEYINSLVLKKAQMPKYYNAVSLKYTDGRKPTPEEKAEATRKFAAITTKLLIGQLISIFVNSKLSDFSIRTVKENKKNKKLFSFIKNEIKEVYEKHPDYKPCSALQFKKASIYNYFMADWREKTAKEKLKYATYASVDAAITVIISKSIPLPGSSLLAIPVKMMLTYCGVNLGIGSVYNLALEIDGQTISFGISYRPIGFVFSNLTLYSFKEDKLIATRLKPPPEELYKITINDAKEILTKYGADDDLSKIKKEVKQINSKNNDLNYKIREINEDYLEWYYNILKEADDNQQTENSYLDWKSKLMNEIANNVQQFSQYVERQTANDVPFLQQNEMIIKNTKKFPVKADNIMRNAPNYTAALQRLNMPLSTHLNGIDLTRVETDSKDPKANISIKKSILPMYTGKDDFSTYAKSYYYGSDTGTFQNLNSGQVAVLMQTAYPFCLGYQTKVRSLQTDLNGIINYINQTLEGLPNQQDMQTDMNNQQIQNQTPAAQGMASTNPNNNTNKVINAAVEYRNFMEEYFGIEWETLLEADITKSVQTQNMAKTPIQKQVVEKPENNKPSLTSPNGTPVKVDQTALLKKQKQVVCEIIKDAFNAKMSAMGMIYRDFMLLMRRHVASYRGAEAANQGNENINQGGI